MFPANSFLCLWPLIPLLPYQDESQIYSKLSIYPIIEWTLLFAQARPSPVSTTIKSSTVEFPPAGLMSEAAISGIIVDSMVLKAGSPRVVSIQVYHGGN